MTEQLKINYTFMTKVLNISYIDGNHYVHFEGSRESISFGPPPIYLSIGDKVKVTFERIEDAKPQEPSI